MTRLTGDWTVVGDGADSRRTAMQALARGVKPAMLTTWRATLLRRAMDVTESAAGRTCLVLAPHPDDETLGCGALIARKRAAGTRVRVLVATDGRYSHTSRVITPDRLADLRRDESLMACSELGVPDEDVVHLGLVEGTTAEHMDVVTRRILVEIENHRFDDVLVTSPLDWHLDHRALFEAASVAVSRCPGTRLLEYPVWAWADGPWSNSPGRSAYRAAYDLVRDPVATAASLRPVTVRAYAQHLDGKRRALAAYASQTTNLTGEAGWAVMDAALLDLFLQPREIFFHASEPRGAP